MEATGIGRNRRDNGIVRIEEGDTRDRARWSVRDIDALSKMTMPIYATGANPDGPFKEGPEKEVNVPISCGGMIINPGDILLGQGRRNSNTFAGSRKHLTRRE
jgi:hypothetical protein